jgi:hypothetical protein
MIFLRYVKIKSSKELKSTSRYSKYKKVSYLGYIAKGICPTSQATADIDQELVANLHLKISKLLKQN